jgi:predicted ATP-dependent protease
MLSCRFRELGGLIRIAGDIAVREGVALVDACHVQMALQWSLPIEEQIALARQGSSPLPQGEGFSGGEGL